MHINKDSHSWDDFEVTWLVQGLVFGVSQQCTVYSVVFYTCRQLYAHKYIHLHVKHVDMFSIFFQLTCANLLESVLFTFRDS